MTTLTKPVSRETGIVLEVHCVDDDCGMRSAFEFYWDGSHRVILSACWHEKRMPKLETIRREFVRANSI